MKKASEQPTTTSFCSGFTCRETNTNTRCLAVSGVTTNRGSPSRAARSFSFVLRNNHQLALTLASLLVCRSGHTLSRSRWYTFGAWIRKRASEYPNVSTTKTHFGRSVTSLPLSSGETRAR